MNHYKINFIDLIKINILKVNRYIFQINLNIYCLIFLLTSLKNLYY